MCDVRLGPPSSPAATRQIITSYFLSFRGLLIEWLMELIVVIRQDTYASAGFVTKESAAITLDIVSLAKSSKNDT